MIVDARLMSLYGNNPDLEVISKAAPSQEEGCGFYSSARTSECGECMMCQCLSSFLPHFKNLHVKSTETLILVSMVSLSLRSPCLCPVTAGKGLS